MAVEPERGVHQVEVAVEQFDGPGGRVGGQRRLAHRHRMAAVVLGGAAERVAQGLGPAIGRLQHALAEGRSAVTVERRAWLHRRALEDGIDVGPQLGQFLRSRHALEDIEAVRPVGVEDVLSEPSVGIEPDRPAIAQRPRALFAGAAVCGHGAGVIFGSERGSHRDVSIIFRSRR